MLSSKDLAASLAVWSTSCSDVWLVAVFLLIALTTASDNPDNIRGRLLMPSPSEERSDFKFFTSFSSLWFFAIRLCFSKSQCSAAFSLASLTASAKIFCF